MKILKEVICLFFGHDKVCTGKHDVTFGFFTETTCKRCGSCLDVDAPGFDFMMKKIKGKQ